MDALEHRRVREHAPNHPSQIHGLAILQGILENLYPCITDAAQTHNTNLTHHRTGPIICQALIALVAVFLIAIIILSASGKLKASDKARQRRKKQQPVPPRTEKGLGKQFCLNCGVELPLGSKFCNKCGSEQP